MRMKNELVYQTQTAKNLSHFSISIYQIYKMNQQVYKNEFMKIYKNELVVSMKIRCFPPGGLDSKESSCNAGDMGSIPGSGRFPGEGNGNLLQYSCLGNLMDKAAWQATVHGIVKSWT